MRFLLAVLFLLVVASGARAQTPVDVELVFAADASGSIDSDETRVQREGHANAIQDPQVLAAIRSGATGRIAVAYIEWAAPFSVGIVVDWMVISDAASAREFAEKLRAAPRAAFGYNSISAAIEWATTLITTNDYEAPRMIIDISGDGPQMNGPPLEVVRQQTLLRGITINAIAINTEWGDMHGPASGMTLHEHFRRQVIGGPGAFVMEVGDDARFDRVLVNKLVREVAGLPERRSEPLGAIQSPARTVNGP